MIFSFDVLPLNLNLFDPFICNYPIADISKQLSPLLFYLRWFRQLLSGRHTPSPFPPLPPLFLFKHSAIGSPGFSSFTLVASARAKLSNQIRALVLVLLGRRKTNRNQGKASTGGSDLRGGGKEV